VSGRCPLRKFPVLRSVVPRRGAVNVNSLRVVAQRDGLHQNDAERPERCCEPTVFKVHPAFRVYWACDDSAINPFNALYCPDKKPTACGGRHTQRKRK
jgi:hypothetical protein